jgi:hypothetical protein
VPFTTSINILPWVGIQYTYSRQRNFYNSNLYGGSIITLFNPIPEIQLSAELEQLRVNVSGTGQNNFSDNFWNTGLFIGAGYRTGNVTLGARYNVLYKDNKEHMALMPLYLFFNLEQLFTIHYKLTI